MVRGSEIHSRPSRSRADRIEDLIRACTAHPDSSLLIRYSRASMREPAEDGRGDGDRTGDMQLGTRKPRTVELSA
jgi:hypothetical protein